MALEISSKSRLVSRPQAGFQQISTKRRIPRDGCLGIDTLSFSIRSYDQRRTVRLWTREFEIEQTQSQSWNAGCRKPAKEPMDLGLFSRTIDNRFVFSLFEFLLSGVTALVVLKAWRGSSATTFLPNQWRPMP